MPRIKDIPVGTKFGRWTVIDYFGTQRTLAFWVVICDCGALAATAGGDLRTGKSTMCVSCRKRTHGQTYSTEYSSWSGLIDRTQNPNNAAWANYGGRGIGVTKRWLKFENFLEDMGPRPPGTSLDRKDNNKGYSKANCRWATRTEQSRNRRVSVFTTYKGSRVHLAEAAVLSGILYGTLQWRIKAGFQDIFKAVNHPRRNK